MRSFDGAIQVSMRYGTGSWAKEGCGVFYNGKENFQDNFLNGHTLDWQCWYLFWGHDLHIFSKLMRSQ